VILSIVALVWKYKVSSSRFKLAEKLQWDDKGARSAQIASPVIGTSKAIFFHLASAGLEGEGVACTGAGAGIKGSSLWSILIKWV